MQSTSPTKGCKWLMRCRFRRMRYRYLVNRRLVFSILMRYILIASNRPKVRVVPIWYQPSTAWKRTILTNNSMIHWNLTSLRWVSPLEDLKVSVKAAQTNKWNFAHIRASNRSNQEDWAMRVIMNNIQTLSRKGVGKAKTSAKIAA